MSSKISKIYLVLLTTCIFCLVLLIHFQSLYCFKNRVELVKNSSIDLSQQNRETGRSLPVVPLGSSPSTDSFSWSSSSSSESSSLTHSKNRTGRMGDRRNSSQSAKSNKSDGSKEDTSHFDIIQMNTHLKVCIREKDHEIDMDEYIFTFQQLYKFFIMLGSVFGFVGSDVKSKIEILQGYREGENKTHYETLESMIEFERSTDFLNTNKESSGSRTFLRLHRALNFVSKFLGKLDSIKETDGTSHVCKEAYVETLSKFHPWLIQKGAILAMYALPVKKELISRVCDGRIAEGEVGRLLNEVIESTQKVYDKCEIVYSENDLLSLP